MVLKNHHMRMGLVAATALLVATTISIRPVGVAASARGHFNDPGNLLITDQYNNRVVEVNPETRAIVWSFGSGNPSLCNPGPGALIGTNDAERLSDGLTLLAGTGVPLGASPADSNFGCADNRVIVVNEDGKIVWQYGQAGVAGSGSKELNAALFAIHTPYR